LIIEITEVLAVKSAALIEIEKNDGTLRLIRGFDNFPFSEIQSLILEGSHWFSIGEILEIEQGNIILVGNMLDKSYLLWVGDKQNRTKLNIDEKTWLKTIAQYVSIVYENLHLIEGLTDRSKEIMGKKPINNAPPWFLRFIFNITEKERSRLALDLHDSVLQEQLYWYRKLEKIAAGDGLSAELKTELNKIKDGLLDNIDEIRKTCTDLRPPFLKEIGIVESLAQLFRYTQLHTNYAIQFDGSRLYAELDHEQAIAIYRIVQELLSNATKHSNASRIEIRLTSSNENIYLDYQDNGIGMSLQEPLNDFKHFGLSGIKERVSSLEGEALFFSAPGEGLKTSIVFPRKISSF
jgi:two-component system sensor histidine kinase ComP